MEVTGDELVRIVKSKDFRSRLAEAAKITMRTGHESEFRLYREIYQDQDRFTPVFEGGTGSTDEDDFTAPVEAGETISAVLTPGDAAAVMIVELAGISAPFTAPGPGEPVVLPPTSIQSCVGEAIGFIQGLAVFLALAFVNVGKTF